MSPLVSTCISNAYEHFLMKGQFPFYVLNLTIPFEKIDVNVHPNKMEVRFGNSNEIYGNVFNAISSTLFNCEKITSVNQQVTNYNEVSDGVSFVAEQSKDNDLSQSAKTVEIHINDIQKQKTEDLKYKDFMSFIKKPDNKYDTLHDNSETIYSKIAQMEVETQYSNQTTLSENFNKSKTEDFFETSDVKFVGEIFATYLIIEKQQKVYIIDEHAGHERLLFERLVREVDSKSVVKQSLLVPFQLKVNRQEFEFLDENLDKLQKIGFEIEEFGELSFMVSAVPSLLSEINLTEFFNNILSDLTVLKNYKQSDLIIDKLMQHSCKCAVRSGKILSAGEVNSLISQMKNEKIQLQCPHGRPIVVELLKSDVEKWFKRIV